MASFDRCSFKIVWIVTQVMLYLVSPYVTFSHFSQLHPSENPDCLFRLSKDRINDRGSKYRQSYSIGHEPSIEIRAILVPCQEPFGKILDERSRVNSDNTSDNSDTSDRERIGNCHKKLIITLKLNNVGKIKTEDEYVIVGHVFDPITMQKSRLQHPYVIKIRREPVLQLYRLKFERVVNAEAREEIITTKEANHTRCNDGVENPTCGVLLDNGIPVPFSQGFCCSCNTEINTTRQTRKSTERITNLSPQIKTTLEESINKLSNRSKSRDAYDRPSNDSVLSAVARTKDIRRNQGHLIYNSRKLKENYADNNVSMIGNTDNNVNDQKKLNRDGRRRILRKTKNLTKNANIRNSIKYINKNADNPKNATRGILFSSKISTKGKIEPYMDTIQEEASRESRSLKDIENTSSLDYKNFVIESPLSSKGLRFEKYKKRKKKYEDDRIEDVEEPGRKNLMDELTELEKAYEALKKMRSKKGKSRSSEKDSSYERAREDLQENELRPADNIEKNAKKTLSDKRKMKMDAEANENKMRETRRCFRLRKTKGTKNSKKKEDRGDLNSGKSMGTLTSRLDEFQARSRLEGDGKIYEDQSHDIEVSKKRQFAKYPLTENASIRVDSEIKKCEETIKFSHENEMFALLTRLLVPDEEILRNVNSFEVKRTARKLSALRNNRSTKSDTAPRFAKRMKQPMKNGRKKLKRREKANFPFVSSSSGNLIKNIENDPREKHSSGNIRVYVQRPDFDLVTDKYLNEPSTDFNSSDNPFLINEDPRQNSVDRHIEEKFGRISEVLKEASDEAKNFPLNLRNETSNVINNKTQRISDWRKQNFNVSRDKEKIGDIHISKNINSSDNNVKIHKFHLPDDNKKLKKFTKSETNAKRQNLNVPWNFATTERNENAVDRIGHVEISSKEVPTTNFVEFKGGTRPLEKVIPYYKSSFSSNPVNGVERYTKKRPGESTDRINVRTSNDSKQISDLIISRSRLNSTVVLVGGGSRPGKNAVSYLDVENSGILLRKINSSVDTKTKFIYKMKEKWKTYGKELISPTNYYDLHVFNKSNKFFDKKIMNSSKNNKEDTRNTKPREIVFYEYNFEDDNNDDDFGRKSRTLLSVRFDDTANQDADELLDNSQNLEYEDYTYPKTDSSRDQNDDDTMEDNLDLNSVNPSKRKIYMDENNYEDFNNIIGSDNVHNHDADKYIKHMSEVIAHRGKIHDSKTNQHENEKHEKIDSGRSKIVKKQVNDVPLYDFISTQEVSNDAKETRNFNPAKNFNFIPENWNEKMNIDDARIYDEKFDRNRGRDEKSSFVDTSSYNIENDKVTSPKLLHEKPMIEKSNEYLLDSRRNSDETSGNIDISVNGNIHVEGGIKGHPISIAFVALPDTQGDSPVISNDSNVDVQKTDYSTSGAIKLNEIVSGGSNDQDYAGSNAESMPNAFPNDSDKSKEEPNAFLMNNNNDDELLGRNRSLFSSLGPQNHMYNDPYKYGGIEKVREDQVTPQQRVFVFNSKLDVINGDDLNSNPNFESSYAEEYEDYSDGDKDLKNLAREKKEAEGFEYRMNDGIENLMEKQSNYSLPVSDENVTLIKIIPEKLFDNVPAAMKNDFSNNFQGNSYGENLSSLEFPSLSDPISMKFDSASGYDNTTSKLDSYNLAGFDSHSMIFPVVFETTVQPGDIVQDWYKDTTFKEMTTISKITEPDDVFRKITTTRLSISDIQTAIPKQSDNVTVIKSEKKFAGIEKSKSFNQGSSTTSTTSVTIADSCYRMKVTVKKFNLSETTTNTPTTTISHVPRTTIQNVDQQIKTLNSSQAQNSTIRERNASAITNFIKKLQAFVPDKEKSKLNVREIIIVPEDTHKSIVTKSNNCLDLKINSNKENKIKLGSRLENSDPDKSVPIFLSSSNDAPEKLRIPTEDSTKENKLRKKTIPESNPKLLSRTSKGSFYSSSWDSSRKEQQHQQSSSGSSTKRSLSGGHDGSDKSFLFYARQKQPVGLPELLMKSQDGNDIDGDLRSTSKRVFLSRNKRNEKTRVGFRNFPQKIYDIDDTSSNVKDKVEVKSNIDPTKNPQTRLPRSDKRKLIKRKKKMDAGEIKKLTGIRRRKKKKKKKKKMSKMGNRENTLDIPEVKTKWRLVKRNLLSVEGTESGRLKRKLGKKRDDGDLEITMKKYDESNASQVGRVSSDVGCSDENTKKKKKKKKKSEEVEDAGSTLIRLRQSRTDGKQVRGGQDCSNRDHPVDVDESKYFESAHCLRFSDLWYSVYRLDGPILDHGVSVQLYEKRSSPDGTALWEDLTPSMIRLNTFSRRYRNNDDSLAFTYRAKREPSKQFPSSLDILEDRLLVPSTVSSGKSFKVAESKGIFEDYLIVRANEITSNGNECDKIGVGFKAFVDQPDRCGHLEGTCLKYQPLSYWQHDREAREAGRAGCYFLSNFASVPSEPIKYNVSGSGSGEFLALEYHSPHVSAIDIEVRNDYNGVASAGPFGRISHIYVDGTSSMHTLVTIVIRNVGSTPTVYRPRIVECPRGLPVSWSNARGIVQMVLPRQNRIVAFDLYGELPFDDFECTVELLDRRGKTVASRRMKVRKMDRCFCVWHCLCACVAGADGSSCRPMSTAHYRAAGFQPPVPGTPMRSSSSFVGSLVDFLLFLFSFLALLLTMGITKWIIGIYVPAVGRWGLDTLLESTRMREYFEEELKCRCIVTDGSGLPVHPDTGSRSIRICSRRAEFFLNVTFFLIYPITVCWYRGKKVFRRSREGSSSTSNDESKACLTSDRDEYQNLVTVSTYGDGRNSKMEAEDTNYVMNELKKSQESLQEYNRYKRYRYYMENQDSRY